MKPENERKLESRVLRAAEAALADQQYVSAIDVLQGMGLLAPPHVASWRRGQVVCLEAVIQGSLRKISRTMALFRKWAEARGLKPSETRYVRRAREGAVELQFSKSGDPKIEKAYRTHFVSRELSDRKKTNLQEKLSRPPEILVFEILRDSRCSECGVDQPGGSFLRMEEEQPLCLACAGMGELEFLSRGDAALTRRAKKHSDQSAVVVRFSRARGHYERQGILVEEEALRLAEEQCTEDAAERAKKRARGAVERKKQDQTLVTEMTRRIRELCPGCPADEARAIAAHTAVRGSGRVGRTAAGRALDADALNLAVAAAVRHRHTEYDDLLAGGLERSLAREQVRGRLNEVLESWRAASG